MKKSANPVSLLIGFTALVLACTSRGGQAPPLSELGQTRPAVHAGSWYPAAADTLRQALESRLAKHRPAATTPAIIALVGPHAGLRYSGEVAAAAYEPLRNQKVGRIFLLGPSHRHAYKGVALPAPELRAYATPLGDLVIDREIVAALRGKHGFRGPSHAHDQEHSLEMHAIFIAAVQPRAKLVPLVIGDLGDARDVAKVAKTLTPLIAPEDVVIASSDFTHYGPNYGYVPFRDSVDTRLDDLMNRAGAAITAVDLKAFDAHRARTKDTICGHEPVRLLLALLPSGNHGREVARDTSGRMTGDYRNSVSYLSLIFRHPGGWPETAMEHQQGPQVLNAEQRRLALEMARKTLEVYLGEKRMPDENELAVPKEGPWHQPYGTFVTLERNGNLRGCIGHIFAVQPMWRDIRDNAIAAAVKDPRFRSVQASELSEIEIEVSVLTIPEEVDGPEAFVVGRHGVVLTAKGKRATFLPQVAPDQNWDRATTLSRLARKAGLPSDIWRTPDCTLSVYEAQVFAESHPIPPGVRP